MKIFSKIKNLSKFKLNSIKSFSKWIQKYPISYKKVNYDIGHTSLKILPPPKYLLLPPPVDIILNNVPGLWTPRSSFYTSLEASNDINKILNHIFYKIFAEKKINTPADLAMAIKNIFKYTKFLQISQDYYYPIVQNCMVSLFGHVKFSKDILLLLTNNIIDYTSFPDYLDGPQAVIEAIVFQEALGSFLYDNKDIIIVSAQNNKNIIEIEKYKELAYKQTGQPYPDYRLQIQFKDSSKLAFLDVKMKSDPVINLPLLKGSISITTNLSKSKNVYIKKLDTDLKFSIKNKSQQKLLLTNEIKQLKNISSEISSIQNNNNITLEKKFVEISNLCKNTLLNPEINNITFSIIIENIQNDNNIQENENYVILLSKQNIVDKEKLFIKDGKSLNLSEWKNLKNNKIQEMIESVSNQEIKNLIIDNYKRIESF
jgi:hypothetical protein